jgi:phenylacetic acid degradation operon negative regulatory protein
MTVVSGTTDVETADAAMSRRARAGRPVLGDIAGEIPTRTLVLGMAHEDGTILAEEVYPVAEACGLTPDQVRSCLRRLVSEGLYDRDGEGRDARFTATDDGLRALQSTLSRLRRAYDQDAAGKGWDRRWHLVAFAVPEKSRTARDALRDHLLAAGGAAIQNGLYVSPRPWEDEVRAAAEELGVAEHVTFATTDDLVVNGVSDPRELARALWALDDVAAGYHAFVDLYRGIPERLQDMRQQHARLIEADFLPGALVIGIKFNECFARDPLLPPELLPRPWPGREARDLLKRSRRLGVLIREDHGKARLFSMFDAV